MKSALSKDPIVLSAEIINALQKITSRENNPIDPIVVTVGSIHGGTKHNIIPDEVKMQLTVRTYKSEVRDRVLAAIDRIAKGIASAAGIPPERAPIVDVLKDQIVSATYNNPDLTQRLVDVWKNQLRADKVEKTNSTWALRISLSTACPITQFPPAIFGSARLTRQRLPNLNRPEKTYRACIRVSSRRFPSQPSRPAS
jgi:metal-dependent amidase/aminoacylase/carboxypeptidase family protein